MSTRRAFLGGLAAAAFCLVAGLKPLDRMDPFSYPGVIDWDQVIQLSLENYQNAIIEQIFRQSPISPLLGKGLV